MTKPIQRWTKFIPASNPPYYCIGNNYEGEICRVWDKKHAALIVRAVNRYLKEEDK